ncbi:GNAT family N-acetyltransferase [Palleronia sp. LCG004]|uniref:GNAT family N-acetyltransferase n=1 Tax=Palleronia sp. LCG004 TaxID=3079304 RepID=UPI0029431699|nr:GNAT family N-acetyltransferase [Palleronia sp. LCG004]WOI56986.1 GNAT family N-acetyltransferase [Palleronia sp. LCG004]
MIQKSTKQSGSQAVTGKVVTDQPIIRSERLIIRPVDIGDTGLLELHRGDVRIARGTQTVPHPLPPGATEAFVRRAVDPERTEDIWIIDATPCKGSPVSGMIRMKSLERGQSDIRYWVAPDAWGAHIASEAVQAMVDANPHECRTMFAEVFQDNPASARVLVNAGFQWLGDAETFSVARNGRVPTWTYTRKMD